MKSEYTFTVGKQQFFRRIDQRTGTPSITSIHPYDETKYHWARREPLKSGTREWRVYRDGKRICSIWFEGTPLNEEYGVFQNKYAPLLYGDSVRQARLDSLMRSELARHNDDVLGMVELAFAISQTPPQQVASWLNLMSPRIKAGDSWNEMTLALRAMSVNMETEEPNFIPAVGEKFVDFAVEYDGKIT